MNVLLLLLLTLIQPAKADNWLCTEASSQREGNQIHSCGIGIGKTENEARLDAFDNAKIEFDRVCNASDDCLNHKISVKPKRTSCEVTVEGHKCYRMATFTIGDEGGKAKGIIAYVKKKFKDKPLIAKGMTKNALLKAFGIPKAIEHWTLMTTIEYNGPMCKQDGVCTVAMVNGKVDYWTSFNPEYTEDLN